MGSRSGKRLSNHAKKARRKARQANKKIGFKRHVRPIDIPRGYFGIHQAIKDYARCYIEAYHSTKNYNTLAPGAVVRSLYVRKPIDIPINDLYLDVHKIIYYNDWCTVFVQYHTERGRREAGINYSVSTLTFKEVFSDPNFFPRFRVFLDECVYKYWGCGTYSDCLARKGGIVQSCLSFLEMVLERDFENIQMIEIGQQSDSPFDRPSVFDVQINNSSVGMLFARDGYMQFQNHRTIIQKPAAWISHSYGFAHLVAAEIKNDYFSSGDA